MIYFITGSKDKFAEVKGIVSNLEQVERDLIEIQGIDPQSIIEAKIREALKEMQGELIVEDTGLYLGCLGGKLPGPLIKWFMKSIGNDGLVHLAQQSMNHKVQAKTIIGYHKPGKEIRYFEGIVEGTIVNPRGKGFGWDPIFQPIGYEKTFGEMSMEEKNRISMRGLAAQKLKEYLTENQFINRLV